MNDPTNLFLSFKIPREQKLLQFFSEDTRYYGGNYDLSCKFVEVRFHRRSSGSPICTLLDIIYRKS